MNNQEKIKKLQEEIDRLTIADMDEEEKSLLECLKNNGLLKMKPDANKWFMNYRKHFDDAFMLIVFKYDEDDWFRSELYQDNILLDSNVFINHDHLIKYIENFKLPALKDYIAIIKFTAFSTAKNNFEEDLTDCINKIGSLENMEISINENTQ